MIQSYVISGDFIESCDCFDLCPCWAADDPDEDHCTGVVAWQLDDRSTVDGRSVAGARAAAVTSHNGQRRAAGAITVLFVDVPAADGEPPDEAMRKLLADAFAGHAEGPLRALARVTGTVLDTQPAEIEMKDRGGTWTLDVRPTDPRATVSLVRAEGRPAAFPDPPDVPDRDEHGNPAAEPRLGPPLTLNGTALHAELRIQGEARAQHTSELDVRVAALPGGYLTVKGRSGMRGRFRYEHCPEGPA